ncbi:uncharacterized protein LOC107367296 isoform X2 [Tetranychus urticae]|nr:uncharacterized protein LOC107367296 isoform X2 [Tetranychus urticae]
MMTISLSIWINSIPHKSSSSSSPLPLPPPSSSFTPSSSLPLPLFKVKSSLTSYLTSYLTLIWLIILPTVIQCTETDDMNCVPFINRLTFCSTTKRDDIYYQIEVPTTGYQTNFSLIDFDVDSFDLKNDRVVFKPIINLRPKVYRVTILATQVKTETLVGPNCMILEIELNDLHCNYVGHCTVVVSVLASFCLILLTALSVSLIILRRKKPLSLILRKVKIPDDDSYSNSHQSESGDQNLIIPRKASSVAADIANGTITRPIFSPPDGLLMPRKSSLKQSRIEVIPVKDDPLKALEAGIENAGYQESEASRRASIIPEVEEPEDKKDSLAPDLGAENRRKSIVTFSDKTEVIRIAK